MKNLLTSFRSLSLSALCIGGSAMLMVFAAGCKQNSPTAKREPFHRYGVEHAHVHFDYSGFARGTDDLYFDGYGEREARVSNYERIEANKFTPIRSSRIQVGSQFWMLSDDHREGSHFLNKQFDSLMRVNQDSMFTPEQASVSLLVGQGAKHLGTDTLLGRTVEVWQTMMDGSKLFIWKGILLKSESHHEDEHVTIEAVSVDTTTAIDPRIFVVPPGYDIHEVEDKDKR